MKAKLVFQLPEEEPDFDAAVNGSKYKAKLEEIWDHVFRPSIKHGYSGLHADDLNGYVRSGDDGPSIIEMLADRYREVMRDEK